VLIKYSALVQRVEGLESANIAQQLEILKLKARVKKLERLNQGRISVDIDDDQEKDAQVKGRQADTQAEIYNIDLDHTSKVLSMQEDSEVQKVIPAAEPVVTAVSTSVSTAKPKVLKAVPAAEPVVTAVSTSISTAKPKVLKAVLAAPTFAKDKGKGIFIEDPKLMKKKDQIAMDAEYARKLQEEEESLAQNKDSKEEMAKEEEEIIKSINETPAQKAANRRRLREQAKEAEDLKKQLEVVADEDDDVFVEATPIGTKVPVKYPLSRFTLEQLVNVARLQVEEESEMSLELLRFTRQQLLEYQQE
nr:hypothetical protein [Tanacetum cinerariifolium]